MKKNLSVSITARVTIGALFLICSIGLFCAIPFLTTRAQNPASGSVGPSPGGPSATWQGVATAPGGGVNTEAACIEDFNCETFTLTVTGTQAAWAGQKVLVQLTWASNLNEYDIWIHKDTLTGPLVTSAMAGPGLTSQTAFIFPAEDGTGVYVVHVVYDTTPNVIDHYTGTATAVPLAAPPPPPAPQDTGPKVGYENFTAPGVLTPVKTTEAGQQVNSVEYLGRNAGEPSVGSNWATGVANFQSGLQTLFITFNDSCPVNGQSSTWVNRAAPTAVAVDSDPIGFTDRGWTDALVPHSRVFAGQLTLLSPSCKTSYTDDDGVTWVPTQGSGIASAVDHESIGGGIYHAPVPARPPGTVYPYAIYYCSQEGQPNTGFCSRSDNGGLTFGASVPMTLSGCGGLHGHVKVSPVDGTLYVPNADCGTQAVVVSEDNGMTFSIHPTPITTPGGSGVGSDPSVGVDSNGRVYFLGAADGSAAAVATSTDRGLTWQNVYEVGSEFGLNQIAFPAAVAGSAGRAAVAFYGSTGTGDSNSASFDGVWHLYVSHTFDGGAHWTTTDVTPNAPMQRSGLLRGGGANITRNLLDFFDMTIDNQGRVLVGYVDGCEGGNCKQAVATATGNAYSTTATIARQSSGRRMLANFPAPATEAPGMPSVNQLRVGQVVHLAWSEADTGNSPITSYQILRGTASNTETLLATVPGTQTGGSYDDFTATNIGTTYYYKVLATNAAGTSCGNNEIAAPYVGDNCTGITIHKNDPAHPEANAGANTPPSLLIDYIAVGEPAGSNNFMFKMKVNSLASVPSNSRWRITWDSFSSPGQQYYVGMTTGTIQGNSPPTPTFEYGTLADAGVPAVFVIQETKVAGCTAQGSATTCIIPSTGAASGFTADGTITIIVPKSAFGNPQPGDLLGAVSGRTITGDNSNCASDISPCTPNSRLERSNAFVDHTFVKAQSDNSYPPSSYTVAGNLTCNVGFTAVSRKTHGTAGTFNINLPLTGTPGIECRKGQGANSNNHLVVVTFPAAVTALGPTTASAGSASATFSGNQVFVNLTGVPNAQTILITLHGVTTGGASGNVVIPMSVLLGDTSANKAVNSSDVSQTKAQSGTAASSSNFRTDVTVSGLINSSDVSTVKSKSGTALP